MKAKQFFITTLAVLLAGLFTAGSCSKLVSKQTYESVEGDPLALKVTTPLDLALAELLAAGPVPLSPKPAETTRETGGNRAFRG